jgi:hypothetical protein
MESEITFLHLKTLISHYEKYFKSIESDIGFFNKYVFSLLQIY